MWGFMECVKLHHIIYGELLEFWWLISVEDKTEIRVKCAWLVSANLHRSAPDKL